MFDWKDLYSKNTAPYVQGVGNPIHATSNKRAYLLGDRLHTLPELTARFKKEDKKRMISIIEDELGFVVFKSALIKQGNTHSFYRSSQEGEVISLQTWGSGYCRVSIASWTTAAQDKIVKFFKENRILEEKKGEVHVLTQTPTGLEPYLIGDDYCPIVRGNYSDKVLAAYDKTIEEFNKEKPNGFITIFSGMPGGGKTFLLRSMLGNIKNAKFLYMTASLVSSAMGPQLISVLQEMSEEMDIVGDDMSDEDKPKTKSKLIIILEDADLVLAPRNQTDVSGVSVLLNLTDGIIGKILNIRIVATTNSGIKDLDRAITRRGRICANSKVGTLGWERSKKIFKRLGGDPDLLPEDNYILADLYYFATSPQDIKKSIKRRTGF